MHWLKFQLKDRIASFDNLLLQIGIGQVSAYMLQYLYQEKEWKESSTLAKQVENKIAEHKKKQQMDNYNCMMHLC